MKSIIALLAILSVGSIAHANVALQVARTSNAVRTATQTINSVASIDLAGAPFVAAMMRSGDANIDANLVAALEKHQGVKANFSVISQQVNEINASATGGSLDANEAASDLKGLTALLVGISELGEVNGTLVEDSKSAYGLKLINHNYSAEDAEIIVAGASILSGGAVNNALMADNPNSTLDARIKDRAALNNALIFAQALSRNSGSDVSQSMRAAFEALNKEVKDGSVLNTAQNVGQACGRAARTN